MTLKDKYGVEFQKELNECKYIPIWSTCTFSKMRLIASILGEEDPAFIRVRVVKERTVEEIDESIKRTIESFNKIHQITSFDVHNREEKTSRSDSTITETQSETSKVNTSIQSERKKEEHRKMAEKREQEIEQTVKENRRILIIIVITIIGLVMLFNAKCSKTRSHHYDYFEPEMEYRHS